MSSTHLETASESATHSRKTQRVYKSPSDANDPSPFSKDRKIDIDAEDEEAGTILMSLAQHANRIINSPNHTSTTYDEKPGRSNSMSIRNLLDSEADVSIVTPHVPPYHSVSTESIYHEKRRNSKKGFQICITPRQNFTMDVRNPSNLKDRRTTSFRHPSVVRVPNKPIKAKYKRNTAHIYMSYRIHAHRTSLARPTNETSPYPSAFRPPPTNHYVNHLSYQYKQDAV